MRIEHRYYDVYPRVVRANRAATITVRPHYEHCDFDKRKTYEILISPMEFPFTHAGDDARVCRTLKPRNGALRLRYVFEQEQEFQLVLREAGADRPRDLANFRVYALQPDLFTRRPYKGEMHIHSNRSDGREEPGYVAAMCRSVGLDYMALTDHNQYDPSLELIDLFKGTPVDMKFFPGEEVHPDSWETHVVNFGGKSSVAALMKNRRRFKAEVRKIQKALTGFASEQLREAYARTLWAYRKIEAAEGLSIFAHPNWTFDYRFNTSEPTVARHFEDMPFAALELTSSFPYESSDSNILQVARYHEERARGRKIPIVGVTDAHQSERQLGWGHTVVFAPSLKLADIIQSIKDLYSVAVETFPDTPPRAHGPYRLVKYTHFLIREVFPQHDELCAEEGRQMLVYAAGNRTRARAVLKAMRGQVEQFYDHCWDPK